MRVIFSCVPQSGHVLPLLPLAEAFARRLSAPAREHLLGRYLLPRPRLALAAALRLHAAAAMDVSDGLAGDLAKLCRASSVAVDIDVARVPLSDAARAVVAADPAAIETVLSGGDDYEILCCAGSGGTRFAAAARASGAPCARIGELIAGNHETIFLDEQKKAKNFNILSFSHF